MEKTNFQVSKIKYWLLSVVLLIAINGSVGSCRLIC